MHDVSPFLAGPAPSTSRAPPPPARLVRIHHVVRFVAVRKVNRWFHSTLFIRGRAMIYTGLVPELSRSRSRRRDETTAPTSPQGTFFSPVSLARKTLTRVTRTFKSAGKERERERNKSEFTRDFIFTAAAPRLSERGPGRICLMRLRARLLDFDIY